MTARDWFRLAFSIMLIGAGIFGIIDFIKKAQQEKKI